jgi:hypothetical protein
MTFWAKPVAAAALMLLAMAGCTSEGTGGGDPSPAPSKKDLLYGSKYHLPAEHAQWERIYQEGLETLAIELQASGVTTPPVDVVFDRFIKADEYSKVHADCVSAQGFTATASWDGGIHYDPALPGDQQPALAEAIFRCQVKFPAHPKYAQPRTEAQIRVLYDYYVSELVPCLRREGYDPAENVSWETFLSTFNTKENWFPYNAVTKRQQEIIQANGGVLPREWEDKWRRINETCPQSPSLERLFPENK